MAPQCSDQKFRYFVLQSFKINAPESIQVFTRTTIGCLLELVGHTAWVLASSLGYLTYVRMGTTTWLSPATKAHSELSMQLKNVAAQLTHAHSFYRCIKQLAMLRTLDACERDGTDHGLHIPRFLSEIVCVFSSSHCLCLACGRENEVRYLIAVARPHASNGFRDSAQALRPRSM